VQRLPPLHDAAALWQIELVREIATAVPNPHAIPLLYDPQNAAILTDGRLVVLDKGDPPLVVFHAEKDSITQRFGRRGSGPGEIGRGDVAIGPGEDGSVYLAELWGNQRISRFAAGGELISDTRLERWSAWYVLDRVSGRLWIGQWGSPGPGLADAATADSVFEVDVETGRVIPYLPLPPSPPAPREGKTTFQPIRFFTVLPSGAVVSMRTDHAVFRVEDPGHVLEIRLPLTPMPIDAARRARVLEAEGAFIAANSMGRPTVFHSHHRLVRKLVAVDDSIFALEHSWLTSTSEDGEIPRGQIVWRMIDMRGRPVGALAFPIGFDPWYASAGRVVGVKRDSLDVATIQVWTLTPPGQN
jgi:hypothetical protein